MFRPIHAADIPAPQIARRAAKVSITNLPQEFQLEQVVRDVENPNSSWTTSTPACKWSGVDCNNTDSVMSISWWSRELKGSLNYSHLPETIHIFYANVNQLFGEVSLETFPPKLRTLSLRNNQLSGTLDLTALPPDLKTLVLSGNQFTGEVCLTKLPSQLRYLYLGRNMLSGDLCFRKLPNMVILRLEENDFSGKIDLRSIPCSLEELNLANNINLCGKVKEYHIPLLLRAGLKIKNTRIARLLK